MSAVGEIIEGLSTNVPLMNSTTWTSEDNQLGQWNSLSVIIYTNTNCTFQAHWSKAGIFADYVETYQVLSNVPIQIPLITINKWVHFTLQNDGANQGYLRLSCYGVVTNNAVQVTFPSTTAVTIANQPIEVYGTVDIGTQPVSVTTTNTSYEAVITSPLTTYGHLRSTNVTPFPGSQLNFQELKEYSPTSFSSDPVAGTGFMVGWDSTDPTNNRYSTEHDLLGLVGWFNPDAGSIGKMERFYSKCCIPNRAGETLLLQFSALFETIYNDAVDTIDTIDQIGFGIPTSSTDVTWYSGYSVGLGTAVAWGSIYSKFRITQWIKDVATYIYQKDFNIDTLQGTGPSGITLDYTKLNIYQIRYGYIGSDNITFSIYNSSNGLFYDFHTIRILTYSSFHKPPLTCGKFIMQAEKVNTVDHLDVEGCRSGGFAAFIESGWSEIKVGNSVGSTHLISTTTSETFMLSYFNKPTFQSKNALYPAKVVSLNCANAVSPGLLVINIYKNPTFSTATSYVTISPNYSSLEVNTGGTISSLGDLQASFVLGPQKSLSAVIDNIILYPGEVLAITGKISSGSATDCGYGLNFSQYL